jgi:hypothetical protein
MALERDTKLNEIEILSGEYHVCLIENTSEDSETKASCRYRRVSAVSTKDHKPGACDLVREVVANAKDEVSLRDSAWDPT